MINSAEYLVNEVVDSSQENITDMSCWQKFIFSVRPTKECFLSCILTRESCKPNQRDVFCFGATALSVLIFPTIGLCIGSAYGAIKNNNPVDINNVSAAFFLLGVVTAFRYGITIGNYLFNVVNSNNNETENNLNINDSNNTEKILQEVTVIDENSRLLSISANRTEASRLTSNLIKIQQTIQVDTNNHDLQQAQDGMNEYYENYEHGLSMIRETSSLTNSGGAQSSDFLEFVAEIHSQTIDVSSEVTKSRQMLNL